MKQISWIKWKVSNTLNHKSPHIQHLAGKSKTASLHNPCNSHGSYFQHSFISPAPWSPPSQEVPPSSFRGLPKPWLLFYLLSLTPSCLPAFLEVSPPEMLPSPTTRNSTLVFPISWNSASAQWFPTNCCLSEILHPDRFLIEIYLK